MRLGIVVINSQGTAGHIRLAEKIKRRLTDEITPLIIGETSNADIQLPSQTQVSSIGGKIDYSGIEFLKDAIISNNIDHVLMSTFFDPRLQSLQAHDINLSLVSYGIRHAYSEYLRANKAFDMFDRIYQLNELHDQLLHDAVTVSPPSHNKENLPTQEDTVLVTAGGAGQPSAKRFYDLIKGFLQRIDHTEKITVIDPQHYLEDVRGAKRISWSNKFTTLLERSEYVISEAGYHTVSELIDFTTKAILIPGHRRTDNQELRAIHFEKTGLGSCVFPEQPLETLVTKYQSLQDTPSKNDLRKTIYGKKPFIDQLSEDLL